MMDHLNEYRGHVRAVLEHYAQLKPSYGDVDVEVICDEGQDHYQVLWMGWDGPRRVHGTLLHLDIRGGKIWVQHDGTEEGVAALLAERGVPKSDIVLGFQAPYKRRYTGFAEA